jgi:hypothetical protein
MKPSNETVRRAFVVRAALEGYDIARGAVVHVGPNCPPGRYGKDLALASDAVILASRELSASVLDDLGTEAVADRVAGLRKAGAR